MNQFPLSFDQNYGLVRQWHPQAIAIDPASIEKLEAMLDAQSHRVVGVDPTLGLNVRARAKNDRGWEVCNFSNPIDKASDNNSEYHTLSGEFIKGYVEYFQAYLKKLDVPFVVDILVFERFDNIKQSLNPQDLDVIDQVRASLGAGSIEYVQKGHSGILTLNPGAVLGSVVVDSTGTRTVQLNDGYIMGHIMEMITTPDGERVLLHPALNTLPEPFARYRSFADRQALLKHVIRPDQFASAEQSAPSATPRAKI